MTFISNTSRSCCAKSVDTNHSIRPYAIYDETVSDGCTLADTMIIGLLGPAANVRHSTSFPKIVLVMD
jgi:hypothetical protein